MKILLHSTLALLATSALAAAQGEVYTQSNDTAGNMLLSWQRDPAGGLSQLATFATGGLGSGDGLGSQGAVTLSDDGRWLLVVNAGSDDVSVFSLTGPAPALVDTEPSLGVRPISVSIRQSLVYVLNAGDMSTAANIAGFRISSTGDLTPIPNAIAALSEDQPGPAQVTIDRVSRQVIVSEKMTSKLGLYRLMTSGEVMAPTFIDSVGMTPFGFAISQENVLFVSEAFGGMTDASAMSSYDVQMGSLTNVSPSVPTTETAACWVVLTANGQYAYTTNTGSGTVSGYAVDPMSGAVSLLDADGVTGDLGAGANPLDAAFSAGSGFLYVLSPATGEIAGFSVSADGSLTDIGSTTGLPGTTVGLAAH